MRYFFHMGLVALVSMAVAQQTAEQCDPSYCRLPDCYCGGKQIPGGYKPEEIPQLVLLTFDDAVNDLNKAFFKKLYEGRTNPNGCPIKVSGNPSSKGKVYLKKSIVFLLLVAGG